jgi:predicted DsbA family dithiol-disulfide isomerase
MSSSAAPSKSVFDPITIDFISDIICPWCYIGFRALVEACARRDDLATILTMRPFELDPTTPKQGADHKSRLLAKFGGDQNRLDQIRGAVIEAGLRVGIDFDLEAIKVTPNTRDCHRLLYWSRAVGVEVLCAEALFQAFHVEGEDLSQSGTLVAIARGIGMDGALVAELLATDRDVEKVEKERQIGVQMGVTGVPCAVFDQRFAVMGAQPVTAYLEALSTAQTRINA